jgi:hypothetical protein
VKDTSKISDKDTAEEAYYLLGIKNSLKTTEKSEGDDN